MNKILFTLLIINALNSIPLTNAAFNGVPIGVLIDTSDHANLQNITEKAVAHINKDSKHKWAPGINILKLSNSNELIRAVCSQMKRGVVALLGHASSTAAYTVRNYANLYKLPFISLSHPIYKFENENKQDDNEDDVLTDDESNEKVSNSNDQYVVNMHPDMVPLLVALMKYNRWKSVYYVYNHEDAINRFQGLLDFQTKESNYLTNIFLHKIEDTSNTETILNLIEENTDTNNEITIMLDLDSKANYVKYLNELKGLDVSDRMCNYILVSLSLTETDLSSYKQEGLSLMSFSILDTKKTNNIKLLSSMGLSPSKISLESALMIDSMMILNKQINNLIGQDLNKLFGMNDVSLKNSEIYIGAQKGISCSDEVDAWPLGNLVRENLINIKSYEGLTGPISFDSTGKRSNYNIDINLIEFNRPFTKIGSFSNVLKIVEEGKKDRTNVYSPSKKLKIVSILDPPFLMLKAKSSKLRRNERYEGYCVDLAEALSKILNFTYEISLVKDNRFGSKDANGNWNGIVGELVRREVDMAISPLTITAEREKSVQFSIPFMNNGISIMVYKSSIEKPNIFSFLAPLTKELWLCILLTFVGVSFTLFVISRFSMHEWHTNKSEKLSNDFNVLNSLWFCFAAFMQQRTDLTPRSVSTRLVASLWWFFILILISSYTANLAAFLTFERMSSPIESAEDLAKQTDIKYGTMDGGATQNFFKKSKIPTYQRMWSFMSSFANGDGGVFVKNNIEGVNRVRESKGKYVFLLESSINEYMNERMPCDTMKVGANLDSKGYAIGTPIGSELKDGINLAILKLKEDGTLEELKEKWWKKTSECHNAPVKKDASMNVLGLENVSGLFYVLIAGLVLSLVVAAVEIVYHKVKPNGSRRMDNRAMGLNEGEAEHLKQNETNINA